MGALPPGKAFCLTRQHKKESSGLRPERTIRSSQVTSSPTKATASHPSPGPEPSNPCLMTASIPETHPALRGWQKETESPPSFLWVINVSAKCMCLISTCWDSLLPVVSVKLFSSLVGILSNSPVTLSFTLWTQLMHGELCDTCSPCTLQSSCFPLRTQLSILYIQHSISGKQQQALIFVQNLLQRCSSPCLWAESIGIYPENTRKWEQAAPLSGTAGFWIKPDPYKRTKQKSRFQNITVFKKGTNTRHIKQIFADCFGQKWLVSGLSQWGNQCCLLSYI